MIKVANIIEEGRLGGPQIRIVEVARRLCEQGIETTVIIPELDSRKFEDLLKMARIKYIKLPLNRLTREKALLIRYVELFLAEINLLKRVFQKENFDLVHVSGGAWQWKGVIAGYAAKRRVVWHLNDTGTPFLVRILFALFSRCADGFIVSADRVKRYYLQSSCIANKPIFEIQAPVDCQRFDPYGGCDQSSLIRFAGTKIVTVGNIDPVKGLESFIEMALRLNSDRKELNFLIIGAVHRSQRAYFEKLKNIISHEGICNVHFLGPTNDVKSVLKGADVYVCSSLSEASPLSVWEAMAMEKPIVATDVGDIARFVKHGESGLISSPGDSRSLAENVRKMLNDRDFALRMGRTARMLAIQELDVQMAAERHALAYKQIMKAD